ncbi:MAG TPA: glycosyltransferase family 39 protein [Candidatus Limnocylindrales bacterium]|nr:glycosyltransferase family 39 protein [Candidatus Limnocylindrales bacterium]
MRAPIALYALALAVRAVLVALFPDPAYPDSYYYVDVARAIAAGHGLNVDFVWIFAEVGNHLPSPAVLPIPSNAHWLPLASFIQAPFVSLLGATAIANALPGILLGSLVAPLTYFIARDAGARPIVCLSAGVLSAVPGAATAFLAQPENFALLHPLVAACLWLTARGLKGDGRSFALAGLLAGLATLARNDGILIAGAIGLVWLADRVRSWRNRRGRSSWTRVEDRPPISVLAGIGAFVLFMVVMGPWWARQLAVFGSISPTSSSGVALWIQNIAQWNSITSDTSFHAFMAQGWPTIIASRLQGLTDATGNFVVMICSVVLVPFLLVGALARRHSKDFGPWFVYTFVAFAGATFLYPLHVPGGAFIHTAIGLAPHAAILSMEGVLVVVGAISGRRSSWREGTAGSVFVWGVVAVVLASSVIFSRSLENGWDVSRAPRQALAAEMTALGIPADDRVMSIDAGGIKYWTGHPGVVSPDDSIETIEAVARAYDIRWLVLERGDAARALAPVLMSASLPTWIGPPVFQVKDPNNATPRLALYPVCFSLDDQRCSPGLLRT